VPASVVTDRDGGVLLVQWGPPSISKLRALLAAVRAEPRGPAAGSASPRPRVSSPVPDR